MPLPEQQAPRLAELAALLADRTRATICLALLDRCAWTAGELARLTNVAPSTVSAHLTRLTDARLLSEVHQGRHRYVRLAGSGAAGLIESMTAYTGHPPAPPRSLRAVRAADALAHGRTCYDHLAGRLGVGITDALVAGGQLDAAAGLAVSDAGRAWFAGIGIDVGELARARRPLVRSCLDWTQRRDHLAGALGSALCGVLFDRGWIRRVGTGRAARATPAGRSALPELLGPDGAVPPGHRPAASADP